ncbi:MAG TPA: DUF1318 domain-containing protein [Acidobacteriota bacterium]|nr:DUF1318 domain-containing protein [Acidobacteriota bacterium]
MRKRYSLWTVAGVGLLFVLACVTVNIYFPEAAVKQAASEIESEIQKKAAEKAGQEPVKKIAVMPQRAVFTLVPAAFAQEETTVSNPAIRALKDASAANLAALMPSFNAGQVGLTNKGLVEIRDEAGLNLQAKAALRKLVKDDNDVRMKLYGEVAKAMAIEASQIEKIQKIFAENRIAAAPAGWWVQKEDGSWVKKS